MFSLEYKVGNNVKSWFSVGINVKLRVIELAIMLS